MRVSGIALFVVISLGIHAAVAAITLSDRSTIAEEKGAGSTALDVGSVFHSSASDAVEPQEIAPRDPDYKELPPSKVQQAISVKEFHQNVAQARAIAVQQVRAPNPIAVTHPVSVEPTELTKNTELSEAYRSKPRIIQSVTAPLAATSPVTQVEPVKTIKTSQMSKDIRAKAAPVRSVKAKTVKKKARKVKKAVKRKKVVKRRASRSSRRGGVKANAKGRKDATGGSGGRNAKARGRAVSSNYKGKVAARIRRQARYPDSLRGSGVRGKPRVAFSISKSGQLSGLRIARSSGNRVLDQAALSAVRRAAPFPRLPEGIFRSKIVFNLDIVMRPGR